MSKEKILCGCGGEVEIKNNSLWSGETIVVFWIQCCKCHIKTTAYPIEAEAVSAYKRATRAGLDKERILKSLSWMVKDMIYRHNQTGIEGNYSPELREAIELENELRKK